MRFPQSFEIEVTEDIIKESEPGDCYSCAIAKAMRYNVPVEICDQVDVGHGMCNVEVDTVTLQVDYYPTGMEDETVFFEFKMDDNLLEWMDKFDNGCNVEPIIMQADIESEILDNVVIGDVNGTLKLKHFVN